MFFFTSHGGEMLGFSNFWAFSPFCQFSPRLSPLSLFLYIFVVKKVVNYLTFGCHLCIMNMSVNRKPLYISLSTDAYSINIHTRTQQAQVFNT